MNGLLSLFLTFLSFSNATGTGGGNNGGHTRPDGEILD